MSLTLTAAKQRHAAECQHFAEQAIRRGIAPAKVKAFVRTYDLNALDERSVRQIAAGLDAMPVTRHGRVLLEVKGESDQVLHFDADRHFKLGSVPTSYNRADAEAVAKLVASMPTDASPEDWRRACRELAHGTHHSVSL